VYLLGVHAYVNEIRGSRSKIPSNNLVHIYIYIYDVKFLALLGAPYIYNISRLRVKHLPLTNHSTQHEINKKSREVTAEIDKYL
jgi:hypothetical protein